MLLDLLLRVLFYTGATIALAGGVMLFSGFKYQIKNSAGPGAAMVLFGILCMALYYFRYNHIPVPGLE